MSLKIVEAIYQSNTDKNKKVDLTDELNKKIKGNSLMKMIDK